MYEIEMVKDGKMVIFGVGKHEKWKIEGNVDVLMKNDSEVNCSKWNYLSNELLTRWIGVLYEKLWRF